MDNLIIETALIWPDGVTIVLLSDWHPIGMLMDIMYLQKLFILVHTLYSRIALLYIFMQWHN